MVAEMKMVVIFILVKRLKLKLALDFRHGLASR